MHRISRLRFFSIIVAALALTACSTQQQDQTAAAVVTPLNDLNLVNAPIPDVLQAAAKAPYQVPGDQSCAALTAQTRALDEVLGLDVDAPASDTRPSLIERGATALGNEVVGTVRKTAEGIVPFRSWIRRISGAERYTKQVNAALAAGTARRAFLKGISVARNCA